jgi:hypothetical protein
MDNSLSEALRIIEREAEREGIQLTRPARLILAHLAVIGGLLLSPSSGGWRWIE